MDDNPAIEDIIGKQVNKQLDQRRELLQHFFDCEFQDFMTRFMDLNEVLQIEKAIAGGRSPFSALRKSCERQAQQLANNVLYLVIYGPSKAGKSTLGNKLLQANVFPQQQYPSTSCACVINSGSDCTQKAKVTFAAGITKEDISQVFQQCKLKNPTLETQLIDAINHEIDLNDLHQYVELPGDLRDYPLVEKVDVTMPIFGVKQPGIALVDCPGTYENQVLTVRATTFAQQASLIIYLFKVSKSLRAADADMVNLKAQQALGKEIIFVLNKHTTDEPESIEKAHRDLHSIFGPEVSLQVINLSEPNSKDFLNLQKHVCRKIRDCLKATNSGFITSFAKLLRVQHLFVSKIITQHISYQTKEYSKGTKLTNPLATVETVQTFQKEINALMDEANKRLTDDRISFGQFFCRKIDHTISEIKDKDFLSQQEVGIDHKDKEAFEKSIKRRCQRAFTENAGNQICDEARKKQLSFLTWVFQKAQEIESKTNQYSH